MKAIKRSDIAYIESYNEIYKAEKHHEHKIVEDDQGVYRWSANEGVRDLVDKSDLCEIIIALNRNGYDKNSEVYRKMYRDMGYSLNGYWEVFYWEMNSDEASEYAGKWSENVKQDK